MQSKKPKDFERRRTHSAKINPESGGKGSRARRTAGKETAEKASKFDSEEASSKSFCVCPTHFRLLMEKNHWWSIQDVRMNERVLAHATYRI